MVRNIETPQTNCFSEIKPDHNWQYCGTHDSWYYQVQNYTYNQRQHYCNDRRTQQDPSRYEYNREKVRKHGNIHSVIPSPDIKISMIPLVNGSYSIKKNQLILL